jgi:hypothetical protein
VKHCLIAHNRHVNGKHLHFILIYMLCYVVLFLLLASCLQCISVTITCTSLHRHVMFDDFNMLTDIAAVYDNVAVCCHGSRVRSLQQQQENERHGRKAKVR